MYPSELISAPCSAASLAVAHSSDYQLISQSFLYFCVVHCTAQRSSSISLHAPISVVFFRLTRLDKRDVDGESIHKYCSLALIWLWFRGPYPDLSSEVEFFDVLYLAIYVILSPAFDQQFYLTENPPEFRNAMRDFYSLFHIFATRFIIVLEGEVVAHTYVVDHMLPEFAAAAVNLSTAIDESNNQGDGEDDGEDLITSSMFKGRIEGILKDFKSQIFPYYCSRLHGHHKHFTWTGPKLQILP